MTVELPGTAEAYDCKWGARGINADVLHQLDDARAHAADEDEALVVALVVFDAATVLQGSPRAPDRAPRPNGAVLPGNARRPGPGRVPVSDRTPDTCTVPYRVRFDEAGPDGFLRTSVLLRYAQDVAWHHSASRGFGRDLVRRARPDLARPCGRGGRDRADRGRVGDRGDDPGRRVAARVGAPPDRVPRA